jgi:hypothetical protein
MATAHQSTGDGTPAIGAAVVDTVRNRVGYVMDHEGSFLQLRPLSGGCEWDADPDHVKPLDPAELMRARVAEANARSRNNKHL